MILRQPLPQRRRHQQHLTTLTTHEISSHPRSVLNPADDIDIPTASGKTGSDDALRQTSASGYKRQPAHPTDLVATVSVGIHHRTDSPG
jgi:hypothetical protein